MAPVLLLHGALGARAQFAALAEQLGRRFSVHTLDFEGHGASAAKARPFRIEHFAENVLEHLDKAGLAALPVFGYSMGGYVGLYLCRHHPARIRALATLGTKLDWTPDVAARESGYLDQKTLREKVPAFVEELRQRHPGGFETVLEGTRELLTELGRAPRLALGDFRAMSGRVRLMVGDRDKTVSIEETVAAYRALQRGELQILPQTSHPLERVRTDELASVLGEFFGATK